MSDYRLPPEIPQLAYLLDPKTVGRIVASGPLAGLEPIELRLTHVRYRPEESCVLTWRARTAREKDVWLSILACRHGRSREDYSASINTVLSPSTPDHEIIHLTQFDAVLRVFPADRKLKGVKWLTSPAQLIRELGEPLSGAYRDSGLTIIHYVAERSCTIRLAPTAAIPGALGPAVFGPAAYGKFYRPGESVRAWKLINDLWNAQPNRAKTLASLVVPKPLAWHSASESVWVSELPGSPLNLSLSDNHLIEIGRSLAALHRVRLEPAPRSITAIGPELHNKIQFFTTLRPDLHPRLQSFTSRIIRREPAMSGSLATLHGDLHLRNIIAVPDGRIGLIDFDNLRRGDSLIDLGSLAAYLHYRGLLALAPSAQADREIELICQGYEDESGEEIDHTRLRFWTATSLMNERAWRTLTRLRPDGAEILEKLLTLAERMTKE